MESSSRDVKTDHNDCETSNMNGMSDDFGGSHNKSVSATTAEVVHPGEVDKMSYSPSETKEIVHSDIEEACMNRNIMKDDESEGGNGSKCGEKEGEMASGVGEKSDLEVRQQLELEMVEKSEPEVGEKSESEVGEKSGPEVGEKSEPDIGEKSEPDVGEKSEPDVGEKSEPDVGEKSEPDVGEKSEPDIGEKSKPEVGDNLKKIIVEESVDSESCSNTREELLEKKHELADEEVDTNEPCAANMESELYEDNPKPINVDELGRKKPLLTLEENSEGMPQATNREELRDNKPHPATESEMSKSHPRDVEGSNSSIPCPANEKEEADTGSLPQNEINDTVPHPTSESDVSGLHPENVDNSGEHVTSPANNGDTQPCLPNGETKNDEPHQPNVETCDGSMEANARNTLSEESSHTRSEESSQTQASDKSSVNDPAPRRPKRMTRAEKAAQEALAAFGGSDFGSLSVRKVDLHEQLNKEVEIRKKSEKQEESAQTTSANRPQKRLQKAQNEVQQEFKNIAFGEGLKKYPKVALAKQKALMKKVEGGTAVDPGVRYQTRLQKSKTYVKEAFGGASLDKLPLKPGRTLQSVHVTKASGSVPVQNKSTAAPKRPLSRADKARLESIQAFGGAGLDKVLGSTRKRVARHFDDYPAKKKVKVDGHNEGMSEVDDTGVCDEKENSDADAAAV